MSGGGVKEEEKKKKREGEREAGWEWRELLCGTRVFKSTTRPL